MWGRRPRRPTTCLNSPRSARRRIRFGGLAGGGVPDGASTNHFEVTVHGRYLVPALIPARREGYGGPAVLVPTALKRKRRGRIAAAPRPRADAWGYEACVSLVHSPERKRRVSDG